MGGGLILGPSQGLIDIPRTGPNPVVYPNNGAQLARWMGFSIAPSGYRRFVQTSGDSPDLSGGGNDLSPSTIPVPTQGVIVGSLASRTVRLGEGGQNDAMEASGSGVHDFTDRIAVLWIGVHNASAASSKDFMRKFQTTGIALRDTGSGDLVAILTSAGGERTATIGSLVTGAPIAILATGEAGGNAALYRWHNGAVTTGTSPSIPAGSFSNAGTYLIGKGAGTPDCNVAADAVWADPASLPGATHLANLARAMRL